MKKIVSGIVIGVILAISASVFANSALIGKTIQGTFPLVIDGQRAEKDVIVVEGTSYIPVRAAASIFGYDVNFKNETVVLTKQPTVQSEPLQQKVIEPEKIETSQEEGEEVENITEAYIYESDVIDIWRKMDQERNIWGVHEKEKLPYLIWDGNVYVPWQIFNNYRTSQNVQEYPNGNKLVVENPSNKYEKGIDYFRYTTLMIKLSLTGYKAEIRDGAVWIVE